MKDKFEADMKKEIKKLQRLRDFFRSNQNNTDIKDKSKLDNGRKMIENVSKVTFEILTKM
jgi:CCR4-NOT transcription complex subunit 3